MQELAQRLRVCRAFLALEHVALGGAQESAVHLYVAEQARVIVRVERTPVADAQLPVPEPDGRLQTGQPRLRVEKNERDFALTPGRPPLRPTPEIHPSVRERTRLVEAELSESVGL